MRPVIWILFAAILLAAITGGAHAVGASSLPVDVAAPLLCWLALRAPPTPGLLSAAAIGYMEDLFAGGGPPAFFTFLAVLTFLVVRSVSSRILGNGAVFAAVLTAIAALARSLSGVALLSLFTDRHTAPGFATTLAIQAALTALLAPPVFALLGRLERGRDRSTGDLLTGRR